MKVLNVGGGASRYLPPHFDGWEQVLLDADPDCKPDICCDAKDIQNHVEQGTYDAVYCSHALEHFYAHDVPLVLKGMLYAMSPSVGELRTSKIEIHVPNLRNLMQTMLQSNLDINDVWYRAGDNPITFHDVLYGWSAAMGKGNLFYAHKCGFTRLSLQTALEKAGFSGVQVQEQGANLMARATCQ